jgi:hypothetical protein
MASALLAKKALRQALAVGARSQATVGRRSGAVISIIGSSRRTLASVKDVTVNVTFINHEVGCMCRVAKVFSYTRPNGNGERTRPFF